MSAEEPRWVLTAGGKTEGCTGCGIIDRKPRWKLFRGAAATCCYCDPCVQKIISEEEELREAS